MLISVTSIGNYRRKFASHVTNTQFVIVKPMKLGWDGQETKNVYRILVGNLLKNGRLKD